MKALIIMALLFTSLSCSSSEASGNNHLVLLEQATAKKRAGLKDIYLQLEAAAQKFSQDKNVTDLSRALKFYSEIFKFDKNFDIVEMFAPIYQNNDLKGPFQEALSTGLNLSDRQEFMSRLMTVIKTEKEGNG